MKKLKILFGLVLFITMFSCTSSDKQAPVPEKIKRHPKHSNQAIADVIKSFDREHNNESDFRPVQTTQDTVTLREPQLTINLPSSNWKMVKPYTYINEGTFIAIMEYSGNNIPDKTKGAPTLSFVVEYFAPEADGPMYTSVWLDRIDCGTILNVWTDRTDKIQLNKSLILKTCNLNETIVYRVFWGNNGYGIKLILEASKTNWPFIEKEFDHILAMLTSGKKIYNPERYFGNLQSQAVEGKPHAQVKLAKAYLNKAFGPINVVRSLKWFKKAADQSHPEGQYFAGLLHLYGPDFCIDLVMGERMLLSAAEAGYGPAQYQLGYRALSDITRPKNYPMAFQWFTRAYRNFYIPAFHQLGNLYEHGKGVDKDLETAFVLQRDAAKQGYAPAQLKMGQIYFSDPQEPSHLALAKVYLMLAAAQGEKQAVTLLESVNNKMDKYSHQRAQLLLTNFLKDMSICQFDCRPLHMDAKDNFLKIFK